MRGQSRERALADDFGLAEYLPDKVPNAFADGEEVKTGVFLRFEDFFEDEAEAAPETVGRSQDQPGEEQLLKEREVLRFSKGWKKKDHRRTKQGS